MIDFAYQLIPIVDEFELSAARFGQDRRISSSDSSLEIVFLLLEQGIRIESNWAQYPPGWQIMTTLTEIQRGAKPFFYDLVIQIQRWAPNALDWEELVGLKRYLDHIDG